MAYQTNMIRAIRYEERKREQQRRRIRMLTFLSVAAIFLSSGYTAWNIYTMEQEIRAEGMELLKLEQEFRQYRKTEATVDKQDVELLNRLQGNRIFWTRKLAALAHHLPQGYHILSLNYGGNELIVTGTGDASSRQDQLIVLNSYMQSLRDDPMFSDVFKNIRLTSSSRSTDSREDAVKFEFVAEK